MMSPIQRRDFPFFCGTCLLAVVPLVVSTIYLQGWISQSAMCGANLASSGLMIVGTSIKTYTSFASKKRTMIAAAISIAVFASFIIANLLTLQGIWNGRIVATAGVICPFLFVLSSLLGMYLAHHLVN